jgi:hypothetical protein
VLDIQLVYVLFTNIAVQNVNKGYGLVMVFNLGLYSILHSIVTTNKFHTTLFQIHTATMTITTTWMIIYKNILHLKGSK